ncbi:MAG: hypothetical protein VCA55_01835 [Verrucomicrobiales bacterium]
MDWGIGRVGKYTSLSHDPDGHPAIVYVIDAGLNFLIYAFHDGIKWTVKYLEAVLGEGFGKGLGSGIALTHGPAGQMAIAYTLHGDLKYARQNGTNWTLSPVDADSVGFEPSISFGDGGHAAIALTTRGLKYAVHNGTSWTITTVDIISAVESAFKQASCSLNHGLSGQPAIAYYDMSNKDLKYAVFNGVSWTIQRVDSTGQVGEFPSLGFSPSGRPAISYYDATQKNLKIAIQKSFKGGP